MKLYIKQKVFSWNNHFTIKDETGLDRYTVEGKAFTLGHKLHVYDGAGQEVAYIAQELNAWLPRFRVEIPGRAPVLVRQKFSWLRPRYELEGVDWVVDGSAWAHDYSILAGGAQAVSIRKEWMSWGDSYELDVADPQDELLALAVVIVIDCVLAAATAAT